LQEGSNLYYLKSRLTYDFDTRFSPLTTDYLPYYKTRILSRKPIISTFGTETLISGNTYYTEFDSSGYIIFPTDTVCDILIVGGGGGSGGLSGAGGGGGDVLSYSSITLLSGKYNHASPECGIELVFLKVISPYL
jgi:hypothetical protein